MTSVELIKNKYLKFLSQISSKKANNQEYLKPKDFMVTLSKNNSSRQEQSKSQSKESKLFKTWEASRIKDPAQLNIKKTESSFQKNMGTNNQSLTMLKNRIRSIEMSMKKLSLKHNKNINKEDDLQKTLRTRESKTSSNQQIKIQISKPQKLNQKEQAAKERQNLNNIQILSFMNKNQIFQTIKFIDQGSYGKVSLVKHIQSNFLFCLKTIKKKRLNATQFNQLYREIQIQSFVDHPNIVKLYGFSNDSENIYLLQEPCIGQNLFKKLSKEPLKEKQVKFLVKQIGLALKYLHQNKIIHRDIKPENIILCQNTVKICDFGWAVYCPDFRKTSCGTPLYYSPQILKKQFYDNKTDIWCLGMLTYELLTGKIPFLIENLCDLVKIIQQEIDFEDEKNLSDQAKHFIQSCLIKDPHKRYNINEALNDNFLLIRKMSDHYRNTIS